MPARKLFWAASAAACLLLAVPSTAKPTKTIDDLKAAYKGETTACAKYAVYARRADQDGYKGVARLFRAASRAEEFHARNHKAALAALGVKSAVPGRFEKAPGDTRANLKDAIKGETYEKDQMYPRMLKDAAAEKQAGATQAFTYAIQAERQHASLYTAALKSLATKDAAPAYYVCPVCGATFQRNAPAMCPACGTPKERYLVIR